MKFLGGVIGAGVVALGGVVGAGSVAVVRASASRDAVCACCGISADDIFWRLASGVSSDTTVIGRLAEGFALSRTVAKTREKGRCEDGLVL